MMSTTMATTAYGIFMKQETDRTCSTSFMNIAMAF